MFLIVWEIPGSRVTTDIGLIRVKEEDWTGFSKGWQGCSKGFPEGKARGKSREVALPAQGKPHPSRLFYSDLHFISDRFSQLSKKAKKNAKQKYFFC